MEEEGKEGMQRRKRNRLGEKIQGTFLKKSYRNTKHLKEREKKARGK